MLSIKIIFKDLDMVTIDKRESIGLKRKRVKMTHVRTQNICL